MPFFTFTGLSPCFVLLPNSFNFIFASLCRSYNPGVAVTTPVWALTRSLATTCVITSVFSSSAYLDVSVQQVCALHYTFSIVGFPIRISADHVLFANPRSFSQLITSFIASESQGIPRVPFLTFFDLYPHGFILLPRCQRTL